MPSFKRTLASLRSYTPRTVMPVSASTFLQASTICSLNRSIPSARDSTTSTSSNLSITIPGRKSASPKIIRQLPVSTTFFRYSHAFFTRMSRNSSSISWSMFLVIRRMRILELVLINPRPIGYPLWSCTRTISPFSKVPITEAISLSKIHIPPAFIVLPSPFFNVTTAKLMFFFLLSV